MDARGNRGVGKSDPLDARRIAAAVLPTAGPHQRARSDDHRAHAKINALTALLRSFPLGIDARRALSKTQIGSVAKWRARCEDISLVTARREANRLAKRIVDLDEEVAENTATTTRLIQQSHAKVLLAKVGVGPVTAAVVMAAWSHQGRLPDEAAFASLAGVNPIPASSGNTVRHRLNRGGDRRLNRALHMAVITRMTHHPDNAYLRRKTPR